MKKIITIFMILFAVNTYAKVFTPYDYKEAYYPGNWDKYLNTHLQYPEKASKEDLQGSVIVKFVVTEFGYIENIEIIRSPYECMSNEVIRVLKYSPKWIPAKIQGKKCKATFITRINFKIITFW